MAAISYKCPNCGGDLRFDPVTQKYKCEYCVSTFSQEEMDAANPQTQQSEEPVKERVDEQGAVVYSCPSCGAEIVTDATTAATFCYYCHNPVVLQGKLSGEYEPDLVIPFAVDKKEAVDSFLKYVRGKRFVPKDFFNKEQIEKISGVYFPFWTYSCKANGEWRGTGNRERVYWSGDYECKETKVYDIERSVRITFDNLTREALNKENKQLVEAVQPYRLEQAKKFYMSYLSGFIAEKRDIEKAELIAGLKQEVERHANQIMSSTVSDYTTVQPHTKNIQIRGEDWKYLLLPVWVLTYRGGDGKLYYYAMNGQTKKVCGVLPVDKGRVVLLFFSIFISIFLILLMGGYFLW